MFNLGEKFLKKVFNIRRGGGLSLIGVINYGLGTLKLLRIYMNV